ncbi:MAG: L,D-transpeptidase [Myxococcota bacterium]
MRPITIAALLWLVGSGAVAQDWVAGPSAPAPEWAQSIQTLDDGTVVYMRPEEGAERRGTVARGTRLALRRRLAGTGCESGAWYEIGPSAFVCDERVRPSAEPPRGSPQPPRRRGRLLPYSYAFVRHDGTRAYAHPSDYLVDNYVEALGEGFGLVVIGSRHYDGVDFVQTRRGLWIDRESLGFARGSDFQGVEVDGTLDHAWVLSRNARVYQRPRGRVLRRASRRAIVHVVAVDGDWVTLDDGTFMRDRDLGRATVAPAPGGLAPNERWIDVDVAEQVMIAYQGSRPVYATLVSTGRNRPSHATPIGEFRIWVKLATSNMDDLERSDVSSNYSIEAVPWVLYFERANGFHAAFWHDDFGRRRSHGCVNLAPSDARWLFDFAGPELPNGWYAVFPTEREQGTLVRVRGE